MTSHPRTTSAFTYDLFGQMASAVVTKFDNGFPASRTISTYGYDEEFQRVFAKVRSESRNETDWTLQSETAITSLTDKANFTGYPQVLRETTRDAEGNVIETKDFTVGLMA